jgi:hypothetical protein
VSQSCTLPNHPCKTLCPIITDLIAADIEVSKRWALCQHSCDALCPFIADSGPAYFGFTVDEIEVSQR